jgi:hypothetical protein
MNKSMENWWNDTDRGKTNTLEENPVSLSLRPPEESWWNDIDRGKTNTLGENPVALSLRPPEILTCIGPGSNPV